MPEKTDISQQIKKYLHGELNARAMHELERRAQDDPFLMDALEGYQTTPVDMNAGMSELNSRLEQRTHKKEARIIPWRTMSIAASILILLGIGLFWYSDRKPSERIQKNVASTPVHTPEVARSASPTSGGNNTTSAPKDKKITRLVANNTRRRPKPQPGPTVAATEADAMPQATVNEKAGYFANADKVTKDTATPLNEVIVMNYSAQKKAKTLAQYKATDTTLRVSPKEYSSNIKIDTSGFKVTRIKGTDIAKLDENQKGPNANATMPGVPQSVLAYQSRVAQSNSDIAITSARGMSTLMSSPVRGNFTKRPASGGIVPLNPVIVHGKMMRGMVKESGEPVAYANVKIKGTTISTLTDAKGKFTLYAVPDSAIIQVLADGYVLKETKVTRRDMQVISIYQGAAEDAPLVIIDNGAADSSRPRPSTGWDDLYTYLRKNAISPDGRAGVVKVSFTVNTDNSVSDFKILQSISTQTDNAAIKLIKDGPAWYSASDDKAQNITISIKFHTRNK